jgi:uncharacterized membrane protein
MPTASNFTTLDDPNYEGADGVNNSGTIVGQFDTSNGDDNGYVESAGSFTTVNDPLGAGYSVAYGINDSGTIAGTYSDASGVGHGFLDVEGTFTSVSVPSATGTALQAINDSGELAGYYIDSTGNYDGFIESGGSFTTINDPNGAEGTFIYGLSNSGEIAGSYVNSADEDRGFIDNNGTFTTIDDPLGATATEVYGVNNIGVVVGYYYDSNGYSHAFAEYNGTYTTIDDPNANLPQGGTGLSGINDAGEAVGFYFDSNGNSHGFTVDVTCFTAGTHILTAHGEVAVENIAVGDTVVTVREGGPVTRHVVWTGSRTINIARHPQPELVRPVRIRAGALAEGVPERDLRLSPHHAVYLNGVLFEAIALVNGSTIFQEQNTTSVTYYHIELDSHDIMLAEGASCESYLNTGSRDLFATSLHLDLRPPQNASFCVPLIRDGEALEAARHAINARATMFCRAA